MQQIDTENGADLAPRMDTLAYLLEQARQDDGGPYRSLRAGLLARRRQLAGALAALDRMWAELEPTPQPSRALGVLWVLPLTVCFGAVCFALGVGAVARQPIVVQAPPVGRFDVSMPPPALLPAEPPPTSSVFREDLVAATMTSEANDTDGAIRHIARGEWAVDRTRAPLLLAWAIRAGGHFEPTARDGAPAGMRVFGIRRGGVLQRLGLQNGDLLVAVAGMPVRTPEELVAAYARLRDAPDAYVALERNGEPRIQHYTMRPR